MNTPSPLRFSILQKDTPTKPRHPTSDYGEHTANPAALVTALRQFFDDPLIGSMRSQA